MKQEGCKVLVVDDNELILELSEDTLSDAGYEVIRSNSGYEGLRVVEDMEPDIVLLDIRMPVMDGFMFLKELKNSVPLYQGKIIILSAEVSEREIVKGLKAGAHDYVTKPFGPEELVARVNAQCREKCISDKNNNILRQIKSEISESVAMHQKHYSNSGQLKDNMSAAGYAVESFYQAPLTVSGDFFFSWKNNDSTCGLFLGDTCGHGISAAIISAQVVGFMKREKNISLNFLEQINGPAYEMLPRERFVAGIYAFFDSSGVYLCNAGQPNPVVAQGGAFRELPINGAPIGMYMKPKVGKAPLQMKANDLLVLYTDGLLEAKNPEGEMYGVKRLLQVMEKGKNKRALEMKNMIIEDLVDHVGSQEFEDDVTLLTIEKM